MPKHYDYIITGAGCAGLSLLMRMMRHPFFSDKQILVIDRSPKTQNDRTWCFWERDHGLFEPVVYHQWRRIGFHADQFSSVLDLAPYRYKMIRGIDFYDHVMKAAGSHPNISFQYGHVLSVKDNGDGVSVTLQDEIITGSYVCNSIPFAEPKQTRGSYHLLQHFKGWVIETQRPCFDPQEATLMDFRIPQDKGTAFMYVMPTAANTALVEYTLFTDSILLQEAYDMRLRDYIKHRLHIDEYSITHREFGVIPMTNARFAATEGRVMQMGTAGGAVKASSGYAFQSIQKKAEWLVTVLTGGRHVRSRMSFADRKGHFYDSVLLQVLHSKKMGGDAIFTSIFQKNTPADILRFLDNESSFFTDIKIMRSVPVSIFFPAAVKQLFL